MGAYAGWSGSFPADVVATRLANSLPDLAPPEPIGAARLVDLGEAADLDPAGGPGDGAGEVVDDDGDFLVGLDVAVLLRTGEAVATDVDRVASLRDAEADRDDVRSAFGVNGGQARERLTVKVFELLSLKVSIPVLNPRRLSEDSAGRCFRLTSPGLR